MQLDQLEKQLQDASRARENRLRKAGLPGRVQVWGMDMDSWFIGGMLPNV